MDNLAILRNMCIHNDLLTVLFLYTCVCDIRTQYRYIHECAAEMSKPNYSALLCCIYILECIPWEDSVGRSYAAESIG